MLKTVGNPSTRSGDQTINNGDLIIGTAGDGIDFSANTPAAGMTSQLLDWYEEGTWTPGQGSGLIVTGSFSSSGTYTRIGRQVTIRGTAAATALTASAAAIIITGLPFTVASDTPGSWFNGAGAAGGVIDVYGTSILVTNAIGSTTSIFFSATYFV